MEEILLTLSGGVVVSFKHSSSASLTEEMRKIKLEQNIGFLSLIISFYGGLIDYPQLDTEKTWNQKTCFLCMKDIRLFIWKNYGINTGFLQ